MGGGEKAEQYNTPMSPLDNLFMLEVCCCVLQNQDSCLISPFHNRKKEKNETNKSQTSFSAEVFFFLPSFFIFFLSGVSDFDVVHSLNLVGSLAGVIQQSSAFLVSKSISQVV